MIDCVGGFGGGHVVRFRADAADAVGQQGHFFHRAANAETLEAAQFRDLEVGIGDISFFIQEDLDLAVAFQPGDGVNCDPLHVPPSTPFVLRGFAGAQQGASQVEPIELPGRIHQAIQNLVNFFRLIAVDDRGEGGDQAGAIVHHTFGRTVAADALRAGRSGSGHCSRCGWRDRCRGYPVRAGIVQGRHGSIGCGRTP